MRMAILILHIISISKLLGNYNYVEDYEEEDDIISISKLLGNYNFLSIEPHE